MSAALERAVLDLLLEHHGLLSIEGVVRDLAPDPADAGERDDVRAAIRRLVQAGLAHRLEDFVFAAAPARRFAMIRNA